MTDVTIRRPANNATSDFAGGRRCGVVARGGQERAARRFSPNCRYGTKPGHLRRRGRVPGNNNKEDSFGTPISVGWPSVEGVPERRFCAASVSQWPASAAGGPGLWVTTGIAVHALGRRCATAVMHARSWACVLRQRLAAAPQAGKAC
jgi:hypothetical protein